MEENYISKESGINFSKVFDQYLRTIKIPALEFYFSKKYKELSYRWANTVPGFNLNPVVKSVKGSIKFTPTEVWKTLKVRNVSVANINNIEKDYYIFLKQVK